VHGEVVLRVAKDAKAAKEKLLRRVAKDAKDAKEMNI
jgi:hypothetical protein